MKAVDRFVQKLSLRAAALILMILPGCFLVFHALIIAGILPRNIVWGGRLTDASFLPLELLAVALNLLLITAGGVAGRYITVPFVTRLVDRLKWFLFYFVVVNTMAALFSTTLIEILMVPVTALYAVCLFRIIKFSDGLGLTTLRQSKQ